MNKFLLLAVFLAGAPARAADPDSGRLPLLADVVRSHAGLRDEALGVALAEAAVASSPAYQAWLAQERECVIAPLRVTAVAASQGSAGGTFRYLVTRTASGTCLGSGQRDGIAFQVAIVTPGDIAGVANAPDGRVVWKLVPLDAD